MHYIPRAEESKMLRQRMQLQMRLALQTCGGVTESIFPEAEAWLLGAGDRMRALEHVAARKNMSRYHSVMDFLFCELWPEYRRPCFNFYLSGGKQLKDIISVNERKYYADLLLKALEMAYDIYEQQRRISWSAFRSEVMKAA